MALDLLFLILFCVTNVICESIKLPVNANCLEFDLWPYKKWEVDSMNNGTDLRTCFEMETLIKAQDLQFLVEIEEFTKWKVNVDRFGPTTSSKGRQVVELEILDAKYNLVRSRHGLENGETIFYLSVFEQQLFRICLINLSLDSSWNAIDTIKQVKMTITSNSLIKKQKWDLITDADLESLSQSRADLYSLVSAKTGQELLNSDKEHRDLNESSFTWLQWKAILLACTVGIGQLIILPCFLLILLSKSQKLRAKSKAKE